MPGLALTRLSLSHYRSYRTLEIDFDGRPVALFGPNGAGKTNLLEAISLLSPGRGLRRVRVAELARSPEALGWRVGLDLQCPDGEHEVVTGQDGLEATRKVIIDGKAASQVALGRLARVLWLVPVMDRLWLEGAGERRNFLDRVAMSLTPEHGEAVLSYEKAMRERNRLLRDDIRDPSWFGALERQMAVSGARIIAARQSAVDRLEAAQESAQTTFPRANLSIVAGEDAEGIDSAGDLEAALLAGRARDAAAGRTLTGPHRADLEAVYAAKGMSARLCSTGEQKALLIALVLANARALAADYGAAPILLLDEVAAHLDTGRRAALYDEIVALGAQAFLSGTGQELFAELGDRAAVFRVSEADGASRVDPE